MARFLSTKTYEHSVGLSCCFRQWRSTHSHCQYLHGYAIQVKLIFCSDKLDSRNWVVDFGGLKSIRKWLEDTFDHKLVVAADDPLLSVFRELEAAGGAQVSVIPHVGCERFAEHIALHVEHWLAQQNLEHEPRVMSVEVREHGGNSAIYAPE